MAQPLDVVNPRTGETIRALETADEPTANAAVSTAAKAAQQWARVSPSQRATMLKDATYRLRAHADELAALQAEEGGKPFEDSMGGVMAGINAIEQYAELGPLHRGKSLQGNWDAHDAMIFEPYGVAVLLTPWNDPVAIALGLTAAALVTGNAVILKPSEKTPLSTLRAAEVMELPADLFQVVVGDGSVGRLLVSNSEVDVAAHVGSMHTGHEIAAIRAAMGKKSILELGGKDAMIIDEGVDPKWAAQQAALGAYANAGQICTSVERIYVHSSLADAFIDELITEATNYKIGPMIDEGQRALVDRHVKVAVTHGANLRVGGMVPDGPGFFYPPTVVVDVADHTNLMTEETFGPVASVRVVNSFQEGLDAANRSDYGLAATVLTNNQINAQEAARSLDVGTVKINAVFGGAPGGAAQPHRGSGMGFGYGPELLDEFTQTKVIHYSAMH